MTTLDPFRPDDRDISQDVETTWISEKVIDPISEYFADSVGVFLADILSTLGLMWTEIPVLPIDENIGPLGFVVGITEWLVTFAFAMGLMVFAIRFMCAGVLEKKVGGDLTAYIAKVIITTTFTVTVMKILVPGFHEFGEWVVTYSLESGTLGENLVRTMIPTQGPGPIGFIVLCILLILASAFNAIVMMFRMLVLIILIGSLPLLAAFSFTKIGNHAYTQALGWLVAFLVFEPVAAVVYGVGFAVLAIPAFAGGGLITALWGFVFLAAAGLFIFPLVTMLAPEVMAAAGGTPSPAHAISRSTAMLASMGLSAMPVAAAGAAAGSVASTPAMNSGGGGGQVQRTEDAPQGAPNGSAGGRGPDGPSGTAGISSGAAPAPAPQPKPESAPAGAVSEGTSK